MLALLGSGVEVVGERSVAPISSDSTGLPQRKELTKVRDGGWMLGIIAQRKEGHINGLRWAEDTDGECELRWFERKREGSRGEDERVKKASTDSPGRKQEGGTRQDAV